MDPDAALAALERLSKEIDGIEVDRQGAALDGTKLAAAAEEMAFTWDGLNEWLAKGGFLPKPWQPPGWRGSLRAIVHDLSSIAPPVGLGDVNGVVSARYCTLCGVEDTKAEPLDLGEWVSHLESCPWRRACELWRRP